MSLIVVGAGKCRAWDVVAVFFVYNDNGVLRSTRFVSRGKWFAGVWQLVWGIGVSSRWLLLSSLGKEGVEVCFEVRLAEFIEFGKSHPAMMGQIFFETADGLVHVVEKLILGCEPCSE